MLTIANSNSAGLLAFALCSAGHKFFYRSFLLHFLFTLYTLDVIIHTSRFTAPSQYLSTLETEIVDTIYSEKKSQASYTFPGASVLLILLKLLSAFQVYLSEIEKVGYSSISVNPSI